MRRDNQRTKLTRKHFILYSLLESVDLMTKHRSKLCISDMSNTTTNATGVPDDNMDLILQNVTMVRLFRALSCS